MGGLRLGAVALCMGLASGCLGAPQAPGADAGGADGEDGGVTVPFLPATSIAGSRGRYCAVGEGGRVACWGDVEFEQPREIEGEGSPTPRLVRDQDGAPIAGATSVAVGETAACAVRSDGALLCWGLNDHGQLGRGAADDGGPHPAAPVPNLAAVSSVAVGGRQVCAVADGTIAVADGTMFCWGRDGDGEVGNGDATGNVTAPWQAMTDVGVVGAGSFHTCIAERGEGMVRCAGRGEDGQNGATDFMERPTFEPVTELDGVTELAAGLAHTCALLQSGEVRCWGRNSNGQLGNGEIAERVAVPELVGLCEATSVEAGGESSCAVCGSELWCWGNGAGGRLGTGTSDATVEVPRRIGGLSVQDIAFGTVGGCALEQAGTVVCWGSNEYGALGVGRSAKELSGVEAPGERVRFDLLQ